MGQPEKFTQQQMIAALKETRGLITLAADRLGCSDDTVRRYVGKYPKVKQTVMQHRRRRVDVAELKLDAALDNGEPWAIALVLKTLGKRRGYYEYQHVKSEVSGPNGKAIEIKATDYRTAIVALAPDEDHGDKP